MGFGTQQIRGIIFMQPHSNQSNYYSMQLAADFSIKDCFIVRLQTAVRLEAWNEISHSTNGAMILPCTITVSAAGIEVIPF